LLNKLDVQQNVTRNKVLREKGFTAEDLEFFEDSDRGTTMILGTYEGNILEIIILRCVLRLYRFQITGIGKEILNNIIVNAVNFRVSILAEFIDKIPNEEDISDFLCSYNSFSRFK
jgi:hypothetical protein